MGSLLCLGGVRALGQPDIRAPGRRLGRLDVLRQRPGGLQFDDGCVVAVARPTGTASVTVGPEGANTIVVSPGANAVTDGASVAGAAPDGQPGPAPARLPARPGSAPWSRGRAGSRVVPGTG